MNNYFLVTPIYRSIISTPNRKIISGTVFTLFHSKSSKSGLHFTLDTSQFRLAKFQAIRRPTWLVATILENAVLDDTPHILSLHLKSLQKRRASVNTERTRVATLLGLGLSQTWVFER